MNERAYWNRCEISFNIDLKYGMVHYFDVWLGRSVLKWVRNTFYEWAYVTLLPSIEAVGNWCDVRRLWTFKSVIFVPMPIDIPFSYQTTNRLIYNIPFSNTIDQTQMDNIWLMAMVSNIYKLAFNSVKMKIGTTAFGFDMILFDRLPALGCVVDEKLFCVCEQLICVRNGSDEWCWAHWNSRRV